MLTIRISRRTALMLILGVFLAIPLGAWASHSFTDVPDTNTFHADIEWLADAEVTKGCNPPANTEFCPQDNVTRQQMAAFLRRLSENQVVDAGKVDGFSSGDLIRVAYGADDLPNGVDGDVVSAEISVPMSGWLVISGGLDATDNTFNQYECTLTVNGDTVEGTYREAALNWEGAGHTFNGQEDCSTTGVHPVDAGTHIVALTLDGFGVTGVLTDASVWALYIPFDGNGERP